MSSEGSSYDEGGVPPADEPAAESTAGPTSEPDYRLLLLAALIPIVIVTAILIRVIANRPHDSNAHPATLTVKVPAQVPAGGCGAADASALAAQGSALEATVTAVDGRDVTLQPKRLFKGAGYERVLIELPAATPPAALKLPTFTDGATYLLAIGADGSLAGCGLTGAESSSLEALYTKAFG